jgi:transposase
MGAPYSQDLRDRVLAAYDRGMQTKQIAKVFDVCSSWARRVKQRRRETGRISAKPMGGIRVVKIDLEKLRELVARQPDATIKELHQRLGVACGESAVAMALGRLKLTFKKRQSMRPSRTGLTSPRSAPIGKPFSRFNRRGG